MHRGLVFFFSTVFLWVSSPPAQAIDLNEAFVEAAYPLGFGGEGATSDGRTLWIMDTGTTIYSFDISSGTLQPDTSISVETAGVGLAWDGANLWIGSVSDTNTQVDAATGSSVGSVTTSVPTGSSGGLTFDGQALWKASRSEFNRFDPDTGELLRSIDTIDLPGIEEGLTTDETYLYAISYTSADDPVIWKIDIASGELAGDSFPLPAGTYNGLAFDGQSLWAVGYSERTLYKISARPDVSLYALSQSAQLYEVETNDLGSPILIGTVGFGTDVVELVAKSPHALYAFGRSTDTVIVVETEVASVVSTVELDRPIGPARGFDLGPDGTLYGLFSRAGVLGEVDLAVIDPLTGVTTLVASLTSGIQLEALAIGDDGVFYAVGAPTPSCCPSFLYTIDPSSGALSEIGSMGIEIDTISFGADGFLYGARSGPGRRTLYRFDPDDASQVVVGDTGVDSIVGLTAPLLVTAVEIDIKPGSDVNCFERKGWDRIPVAILGRPDFDPSNINIESLKLDSCDTRVRSEGKPLCWLDDVNDDQVLDLHCKFADRPVYWNEGEGTATLTGELNDGTKIEGSDSICAVPVEK